LEVLGDTWVVVTLEYLRQDHQKTWSDDDGCAPFQGL